jgi:hypothetical protein
MKTTQSFDAIGTLAAPVTLTATNTDNVFSKKSEVYDSVVLRLKYTPRAGQTNRYAKIYVLESDNGTNWYYRAIRITGVDVSDIYTIDPAGAVGIYEKVPNGGTSTGGAAYQVCYKVELAGLKHFRIMASEDGAANFGTLYVGLTFLNPQCR